MGKAVQVINPWPHSDQGKSATSLFCHPSCSWDFFTWCPPKEVRKIWIESLQYEELIHARLALRRLRALNPSPSRCRYSYLQVVLLRRQTLVARTNSLMTRSGLVPLNSPHPPPPQLKKNNSYLYFQSLLYNILATCTMVLYSRPIL